MADFLGQFILDLMIQFINNIGASIKWIFLRNKLSYNEILKQNGLKHYFFVDFEFITIGSFDPEFIHQIELDPTFVKRIKERKQGLKE